MDTVVLRDNNHKLLSPASLRFCKLHQACRFIARNRRADMVVSMEYKFFTIRLDAGLELRVTRLRIPVMKCVINIQKRRCVN